MEITMHYSTKTGTIKKVFNKLFPYLKLEFLKTVLINEAVSSWSESVLHNRYLGEINHSISQGSITISGEEKAMRVEQLFQQEFGLPVKIFRKNKKAWVTTATDDLTLAEQNEIGKESCQVAEY